MVFHMSIDRQIGNERNIEIIMEGEIGEYMIGQLSARILIWMTGGDKNLKTWMCPIVQHRKSK